MGAVSEGRGGSTGRCVGGLSCGRCAVVDSTHSIQLPFSSHSAL